MDIGELHHCFECKNSVLYWKNPKAKRAKKGAVAGYICKDGYRQIVFNGKRIPAHKIIWAMAYGSMPDMLDHINGDRTDNRLENLRPVTKRENNMNKKIRSDNTTGITGVRWHEQRQKWNARIALDGKERSLGMYEKMEDAKMARLKAELIFFKEYGPNYSAIMSLVAEGKLIIAPASP